MKYSVFIFFIISINIYSQTLYSDNPIKIERNNDNLYASNAIKLRLDDIVTTDENTVVMIEYNNKYYYIAYNSAVSIGDNDIILEKGMIFERHSKYKSLDIFLNKQKFIKLYADPYPFYAGKIGSLYILSMEKIIIKKSSLRNSALPMVVFNLAGSNNGYNVYRSIFGIHPGWREKILTFKTTFNLDDNSTVYIKEQLLCNLTPPPPEKPNQIPGVNKQMKTILGDAAKSGEERKLLQNDVYTQFIPKLYSEDDVHIMPSFGRYSSYYGAFRGYTRGYARFHEGFDIANERSTYIRASNAGVVRISRELFVRGNCVVIDHGEGVFTSYFHMSKLIAKEGTFVKKGDIIGEIGTTGMSTGNHLHWELRAGNVCVDPLSILDRRFVFNEKNMILIR